MFRILLLVWFTVLAAQAQAQGDPPIGRRQILEVLQQNLLTDQAFAARVNTQHLSFEMTMADEEAFRKAGAGPLLIAALWEHDTFRIAPGLPPLTRQQIVTLLESDMPSPRVERIVKVRKVSMVVEKSAIDEIRKAAPGSTTLIDVITENIVEEKAEVKQPVVVPPPPPPSGEDLRKKYDALVAQARTTARTDATKALEILADAKKLDRSRPDAFALDGYIQLYQLNSPAQGGAQYKEAITKGGEVQVKVRYSFKKTNSYGWLWIGPANIRFESDDKLDKLPLTRKQIVEVGLHFKARVKEDGLYVKVIGAGFDKESTLHFYSAQKNQQEDSMLVELLR